MRNITGNHGRLASRSIAAGLVLLLVVAGWPPTAAARKIKLDWSWVQAVRPGTPTTVILYQDQAPSWELRKIKGRFHSATDDSLTLTRKDGQRRTFQKLAVRKVFTRRPIWKRYQGWLTLGIIAVLSALDSSDLDPEPGREPSVIGLSTAIAFAVAPRWGGIYNMPPKHRTQPPADKPSGSNVKAGFRRTGLRLPVQARENPQQSEGAKELFQAPSR